MRDKASYVLEQGDIRFVVSGALTADSPIAEHVRTHGDGVHDLAWLVDDAGAAYDAAIARGAESARAPWSETDEHGTLSLAQIKTYGETRHTFVEPQATTPARCSSPATPTRTCRRPRSAPTVGLTRIDHVVGNVEQGKLDDWVRFYAEVMGFDQLVHFDDAQIATEYSALMSTVVWDGSKIVMPINEPADGRKKSQIQEYVETYDGPGVQHIALRTDDIVATVAALRARGVRFMRVPDTYYDEARARLDGRRPAVGRPAAPQHPRRPRPGRAPAADLHRDRHRPARRCSSRSSSAQGARGFGEGNFKALFEAIERDQARRGNL